MQQSYESGGIHHNDILRIRRRKCGQICSFVHCQALALQANQSAASAVLALDHTLREVTYAH